MITLLIARHGNTFEDHEPLRRVGARTDLPLTQKGREQAAALGRYLKDNNLYPDSVYCSELNRTYETAKIALESMNLSRPITTSKIFNEIDYGIDENKPESEVISRIGTLSIKNWEENFTVPDGWIVDKDKILLDIQAYSEEIINKNNNNEKLFLVVTSNGIARFFTKITPLSPSASPVQNLKLGTGCLAKMSYTNNLWSIDSWNIKP